ncbi:rhomboid family intramembrane serine protease [Salibacterium lacus]|uniref:Rhomboid family intramembrane serine protease n=1 Tax=Salibacterium lacus TaxID=1898109 RepID=A0ABW5T053_9BACI
MHRYWKLIHHLVIKEDARIIEISRDKKQIWLETGKNKQKAIVRLARIEHDWMNQVERDVKEAGQEYERIKRMILGRNIPFYSIYVTSYPPADLTGPLNSYLNTQNSGRFYLLCRDPSGRIAESEEQVLNDLGARLSWEPALEDEYSHEEWGRYYRAMVKEKQEKLENEDRSLLLFTKPRAVFFFLAAIVSVFTWMEQTGESTNLVTLIEFGAKYNPALLEGEWWRIITSMFLHIGIFHLVMNSLALFYIGGAVERMYGTIRFIIIYMTAGVFGSLASFAFNDQVSAGASGAIFGCFGALLYFGMIHRALFFRTMGLNVLFILGLNLVFGFVVPAVDNGAHIGGLAGGFLASALVHLPKHSRTLTQLPFLLVIPGLAAGLLWYGIVNEDSQGSSMVEVQLAQQYLERDNVEEARQILNDAENGDNNAYVPFVLGNTYMAENQYRQAVSRFQEAVSINEELAEGHYNLAIAYSELGQWEEAEQSLNRSRELGIENQSDDVDVESIEDRVQANLP